VWIEGMEDKFNCLQTSPNDVSLPKSDESGPLTSLGGIVRMEGVRRDQRLVQLASPLVSTTGVSAETTSVSCGRWFTRSCWLFYRHAYLDCNDSSIGAHWLCGLRVFYVH